MSVCMYVCMYVYIRAQAQLFIFDEGEVTIILVLFG